MTSPYRRQDGNAVHSTWWLVCTRIGYEGSVCEGAVADAVSLPACMLSLGGFECYFLKQPYLAARVGP